MRLPFLSKEGGSYQKILGTYFFRSLPKNFYLVEDLPEPVREACGSLVLITWSVRGQKRRDQGMGFFVNNTVCTASHVAMAAGRCKAKRIKIREVRSDGPTQSVAPRAAFHHQNLDLAVVAYSKRKRPSLSSNLILMEGEADRGEYYIFGQLYYCLLYTSPSPRD